MDRDAIYGLVGRKVIVGFNAAEGGGVEVSATLDEVRDDGIVLSQISDLVPGPTLFCPWESFRRARERVPWFMPPHNGPEEELQIREPHEPGTHQDEQTPVHLPERRREPSARTLERVVPIAQRQSVGGITVALASLELHGGGLGALRWRVSFGEEALRDDPDLGFWGISEPEFEVRDGEGRILPWSPRGAGGHDGQADGEAEVRDLPDGGEIKVVVRRLVADAYGPEGEHEGPSCEGPWTFRFTL